MSGYLEFTLNRSSLGLRRGKKSKGQECPLSLCAVAVAIKNRGSFLEADQPAFRPLISPIAHSACSEISGSESFAAISSAGKSSAVPVLPKATQTFLKNLGRLMRLMGDFAKTCLNVSSSIPRKSLRVWEKISLRA